MARTAVIVIGGAGIDRRVLAQLPGDRYVVAADSGFDHALTLGLTVDLLVGDLDSISGPGRAAAEAAGTAIERHRPDKDATDTELAVAAALRGDSATWWACRADPGRRDPARSRAGGHPVLHPTGPRGRDGRGLVGPGPPAGGTRARLGAGRGGSGPGRVAPSPPRARPRHHHGRAALPAGGRGTRPRLQPRHQQRGRSARSWRRAASAAPCSSSPLSPSEVPHEPPVPSGPSRCGRGRLPRGDGGLRRRLRRRHLVRHRATARPDAVDLRRVHRARGARLLHRGDRHRGDGGQGRRRGNARQQGHHHRRPTRGRRAVGPGQHVAVPRPQPRRVRTV